MLFFIPGLIFILPSCILNEFRFNDVSLKDDWKMEIISPLFTGNFTFKDLVDDWNTVPDSSGEPSVVIVSVSDTVTVPLNIIYEPAVIIEGFNFLIEGDEYLSEAALNYTVVNGSPFPLNFQMYFYEKEKPTEKGPAFLPPAFAAGNWDNDSVTPMKTAYSLVLTQEQLESFKSGNRIDFSTWFDSPEPGIPTDTIRADYPVEISIILTGIIHRKYE